MLPTRFVRCFMLRGEFRVITERVAPAPRSTEEPPLATPNYSFEKRQRELAKKRKAEEKRQRKQVHGRPDDPGAQDQTQSGQGSGSEPAPAAPGADPAP